MHILKVEYVLLSFYFNDYINKNMQHLSTCLYFIPFNNKPGGRFSVYAQVDDE